MLRKSFALILLALCLGVIRAEDPVAAATSAEPAPEARRASETEFKKSAQINPEIKITKIHEFRNDEKNLTANNHALQYESQYWNFGAVTREDINNRKGHYFVITWVNKGAPANFTTRFEYRQVKTKDIVRTLTMDHPNIKGATRSTFAVLGDAFLTYGPVYAWRFTILRGDEVVGEEHSFIW